MELQSLAADLPAADIEVGGTEARDILRCPRLKPDASIARELAGSHEAQLTLFQTLSGREHALRRRDVGRALSPLAVLPWAPKARSFAREAIERVRIAPMPEEIRLGDSIVRPACVSTTLDFLCIPQDHDLDVQRDARDVLGVVSMRRRRVAAAKLYRLAVQHASVTTLQQYAPHASHADELGVALPLLTVGTELSSRVALACIYERLTSGSRTIADTIDSVTSRAGIARTIDRIADSQVEIRGHTYPEGARVRISLGGSLPPGGGGDPLPFGFGSHYCPGASWVRMLAQQVATATLAAFPSMRLREGTWLPPDIQPGGPMELLITTSASDY
jgi:hypothetical protein